MRIAFFSNFLNHHQLPICQEFLKSEGVEFVFVATKEIEQSRLEMGYKDMNEFPFVLRAYEGELERQKAMEIAETYDVVVLGAAPIAYLKNRMKGNKLTFRFCERPLKKGTWRRFIPKTKKRLNETYIQYKDSNLYVLGASAYTSSDLALCGFPKEKCFRWGYFPAIENRDVDKLLAGKKANDKVEILYAGRLLKLKRVGDTVKALHYLQKKGVCNFHFTIIGDGAEKQNLYNYVKKYNLGGYIDFLPFMKPEEVRKYMDKTDIYVFGSNFYEGWGAVVNEAMNSACALVVSHAVGSAAYLIDKNKNGIVYQCGDVKSLAKFLETLIINEELRLDIGRNAYQTITSKWTAKTAVERFLMLCGKLSRGENYLDDYSDGPCSKADIIKNKWVNKR